jgi:hypothetical protein
MTFIKIRSHRRKFSNSDSVEQKINNDIERFKMIVDKYGNYVRKFMWQLYGWGIVDICMTK